MVSHSDEIKFMENEKKDKIQAVMMRYVNKKLSKNNNVYKIEDINGVFDHMHERVKNEDGSYASCSQVNAGNDVFIINFHVKEENGRYSVVKEVLYKKNDEEVNRILWKRE